MEEVNSNQILYDRERGHWVTTWFSNGKVYLMDSLFAENLSQSIEMQISVIFRNADKGNGMYQSLPFQFSSNVVQQSVV